MRSEVCLWAERQGRGGEGKRWMDPGRGFLFGMMLVACRYSVSRSAWLAIFV